MAVSHKDFELPNSRNWLAEMDIKSDLDVPILTGNVLEWKSCKLKCQINDCFHLTIFTSVGAQKLMRKKKGSKLNERTLEELNSVHRRSQAKSQLLQPSYIKRFKLFLFVPSVLKMTSVKILPYRPIVR